MKLGHSYVPVYRWIALLLAAIACVAAPTISAHAQPFERDTFFYSVPMGAVPASGTEAFNTFEVRRRAVLQGAGCADDPEFWGRVWAARAREQAGEGLSLPVIAKMGLLAQERERFQRVPTAIHCTGSQTLELPALNLPGAVLAEVRSLMLGAIGGMPDALELDAIEDARLLAEPKLATAVRNLFADNFGVACKDALTSVRIDRFKPENLAPARAKPAAERAPFILVTADYALTLGCLRTQINVALMKKQVVGLLGSSKLPCFLERDEAGDGGYADPELSATQTTGEWDVDVRDLIRIVYLDRDLARGPNLHDGGPGWILDFETRKHITENLITVDGPPGDENYSPLQCGNQEHSSGSPQERLEEREWTEEALDSLGNFLEWLLRRVVLILAIVAAGVAAIALLPTWAPAVVAAAAVAVALAGTGRIPETENHLLMIESSRYLNNQWVLRELARDHRDEDRGRLENDQRNVRDALAERLRAIFHRDFEEYNARPYQRYSLMAIMNLAQFAGDDRIRIGAQLVLDKAAAKAAIASNEGVRYVPFRRLRSSIRDQFLCDFAARFPCASATDINGGADLWIGLLQLYGGQTRNTAGFITRSAARQLVYSATSDYRVPTAVLDLLVSDMQRSERLQVLNHEVPEVTYSTPAFVLSAGGKTSGPANRYELDALGKTIISVFARNDDEGTAMPTTLQLRPSPWPANAQRLPIPALAPQPDPTILANVLRIHGKFTSGATHQAPGGVIGRVANIEPSFDRNLCVVQGFACGMNIAAPAAMEACLQPEPAIAGLSYIDTTACPGVANVARVYIALFRRPCDADTRAEGCYANVGFFEAVDPAMNPSIPDFQTFKQRVRERNGAKLGGTFQCADTYVSARGGAIDYRCDQTHGVVRFGGADLMPYEQESPARGNVYRRFLDGYRHQIASPDPGSAVLVLDWVDPNLPSRSW